MFAPLLPQTRDHRHTDDAHANLQNLHYADAEVLEGVRHKPFAKTRAQRHEHFAELSHRLRAEDERTEHDEHEQNRSAHEYHSRVGQIDFELFAEFSERLAHHRLDRLHERRVQAPKDVRPVGAVPKSAKQEDDEDIQNLSRLSLATAP